MHVYYTASQRGDLRRRNSSAPSPVLQLPQPNCHCCTLGCGRARGYEVGQEEEECSILLNGFAVVDLGVVMRIVDSMKSHYYSRES